MRSPCLVACIIVSTTPSGCFHHAREAPNGHIRLTSFCYQVNEKAGGVDDLSLWHLLNTGDRIVSPKLGRRTRATAPITEGDASVFSYTLDAHPHKAYETETHFCNEEVLVTGLSCFSHSQIYNDIFTIVIDHEEH
ncbi:hypothetical protein CEXT_328921 [Caerostris extrusa]|uniref:Secreted protein n=1 Tax=Caerostris extrusa TaxID=172846 RepID=A0AAV4U231_CAEEX|nr:hypothetical protein CEXT_328921 [Caerostris extrusa]